MTSLKSIYICIHRVAANHNKMANIFVFGNYAAVAAKPNCEFHAPNVVSESSSLKLFAKTKVNLSFGLKPDFRSGISFCLKLYFKAKVLAEK